jgi:hypothetical protein
MPIDSRASVLAGVDTRTGGSVADHRPGAEFTDSGVTRTEANHYISDICDELVDKAHARGAVAIRRAGQAGPTMSKSRPA